MEGFFEDTATNFADRFNAAVANLDAQVSQMNARESELWEVQPAVWASGDERLQSDWDNAMQRIIAMSASVDSMRGQIATVAGWWSGVKSSFGVTASTPGVLNGVRNLGLLPAVPWSVIALIVGGTAAIASVIYAASAVINRARQYQYNQAVIEATAAGLPVPPNPFEGADNATGGLFEGLGDVAMWATLGALVLLFTRGSK